MAARFVWWWMAVLGSVAVPRVVSDKPLVVFTVATEATDGFKRFERSAARFDVDVKVLGMGSEWKGGDTRFYAGGGQKVAMFKKALEPYKEMDDQIVMFTDSYDVILNAGSDEIVKRFKNEFPEARVLFSAEGFCWPNKALAVEYPIVKSGKRYLNSGLFIGYAPEVYNIVASKELKSDEDDQLFYTEVFLDEKLRETYKILLDSTGKIFQNLHGAEEDVLLKFSEAEEGFAQVHNVAYDTWPCVVHGNGLSKGRLDALGNYLAEAWSPQHACAACREETLSLEAINEDSLPVVTLALFIELPTPFLTEFLKRIGDLDYPKSRINLFVRNAQAYHDKDVKHFLDVNKEKYKDALVLDHDQEMHDSLAREKAMEFCLSKSCQFHFVVDSEAQLLNAKTLRILIEQNRPVLAPMLTRPGKLWSNFWGALSEDGFYARSDDYLQLVQRDRKGVWNVPFVTLCYLIRADRLESLKGAYVYNQRIDVDMSFAQFLRDHGYFMYVDNLETFGHLITVDNYELSHLHNDLYQVFDNQLEWERRYLHANYSGAIAEGAEVPQPCPDVYNFPLFSEKFCADLIAEMEHFGRWSGGTNQDSRLAGGYENVPTRDIHMNQIGMERHFLYILDTYVRPMQEKVFIGYYHQPVESLMMFVVRYRPDEQPNLRPHHDASTYTIDVALNRHNLDYEGGGVRFIRYNCSLVGHEVGWSIVMPGRLTHYHEGLTTTKGTRYILISFINP